IEWAYRLLSEFNQEANRAGQLIIVPMLAVDSVGGCTGEIASDFRTDVQATNWVPVQSQGHLLLVGPDTSSCALGVIKPFRTALEIDELGQVIDADGIEAIERTGPYWCVNIPAHVVLNDLGKSLAPIVLQSQFHHIDKCAVKTWCGEDRVRSQVDRAC